jgi:cytochrome c oxidase subunit 2
MFKGLPLFPSQASEAARDVDNLYFYLLAVSVFFAVLIVSVVAIFAVRYRRRKDDEHPAEIHGSLLLEVAWSIIPLLLVSVMFVWGASVFFSMNRPPDNALQVSVVGKRWMWKIQHMTGQREINELHVPVDRSVRLTITSEDVIHSFFVPAFRLKKDAVPGRYNIAWFKATQTGRYHLFCAEYCGTDHSKMIGTVIVMTPAEYQAWLAGGPPPESPVALGQKLFSDFNCTSCHRPDSTGRGPWLANVFGKRIRLVGGGTVLADEDYLRESILNPAAKVVEGYQPIMPTYGGQVSEENLLGLIAYIKSLTPPAPPGVVAPAAAGPNAPAGGTGNP